MARRLVPLSPEIALRRLRRRPDVAASVETARRLGVAVRVVGGAVRDAFLADRLARGTARGDLDLALHGAESFALALARHAGTRAMAVGTAPRQVWKVPFEGREIDVWETGGDPGADLLRRDVTVNALAFDLPGGVFSAPASALDDLAHGRLRPPRPGVYLEDPVRVLRVARFEAALDGFTPVPSARAELRAAAARLDATAVERRVAELDTILTLGATRARRALGRLEGLGALARLLPGRAGLRAAGIAMATRISTPDAGLARALLVSPFGRSGIELLESWKVPRRDLRLASALARLPEPPRDTSRREVATWLRAARPFSREAIDWARARGAAAFARAARRLAREPGLEALVEPRRPLSSEEVARLLSLRPSPALGAALEALDLALAAAEIHGAEDARRFLLGWKAGDGR